MFRFAVIAAVGVFLASCSGAEGSSGGGTHGEASGRSESALVPERSPHITGVITEVKSVPGGAAQPGGRVLIEEVPKGCFKGESEKGCDKLHLDMTEKTRILRKVGGTGTLSQARATDLRVGQRVRAWHTGVLTKSYPAQGSAQVIVVDATNGASEDAAQDSESSR